MKAVPYSTCSKMATSCLGRRSSRRPEGLSSKGVKARAKETYDRPCVELKDLKPKESTGMRRRFFPTNKCLEELGVSIALERCQVFLNVARRSVPF
jgi:hypothetical protein